MFTRLLNLGKVHDKCHICAFFLLYLCRERIIYIDTHYFKYSVNIWMLVMSYSSLRCNCVLDEDLFTEGFIISALILYNPMLKSEIIFQNSEVNLKSKWIRHSDDFRIAFMRTHIIESRDFFFSSFFPSSFFHFFHQCMHLFSHFSYTTLWGWISH